MAEVQSLAGKIRVPVKFCDDMMPGAVALPHGWGHRKADGLRVAKDYPGVNVNLITPIGGKHCEKLAGMSQMTAIFVDVRNAQPQPELSTATL